MPAADGDVTRLLARWATGDRAALDALMPIVYGELRKIADAYLQRARPATRFSPPRSFTKRGCACRGRISRPSITASGSTRSPRR